MRYILITIDSVKVLCVGFMYVAKDMCMNLLCQLTYNLSLNSFKLLYRNQTRVNEENQNGHADTQPSVKKPSKIPQKATGMPGPSSSIIQFVKTIEKSIERCSNSINTAKDDLAGITNGVKTMTAEIKAILDTTKAFKKGCIRSTRDNRPAHEITTTQEGCDQRTAIFEDNRPNLSPALKQKATKQKTATHKTQSEEIELNRNLVLPPIGGKDHPENATARTTKSSNLDMESDHWAGSSKLSQIKKIAQRKRNVNASMKVPDDIQTGHGNDSKADVLLEFEVKGESAGYSSTDKNKSTNSHIPVLIRDRHSRQILQTVQPKSDDKELKQSPAKHKPNRTSRSRK